MTEPKKTYEIGDETWIFVSGHKGEMSKGKVVHKFTLPSWPDELYVVEVQTYVDPLLEVRDWAEMSADGKRIGPWLSLPKWVSQWKS